MFDNVSKVIYFVMTASLRMSVFQMVESFEKDERLSKDEFHHIQWVKLQKLIKDAVTNSQYYRDIFSEMGAEPNDIQNESDFKKIPILTKDMVRENYHKILARHQSLFLHKAKTSGSTGKPLKFYKDPNAVASTYAAMYRGHRWFGVDIGAREARLWGVPMDKSNRIKTKVIDTILNRTRQDGFQLSDELFSNYYNKLTHFNAKYLMGYPSLVFAFAQYLKAKGVSRKHFKFKFVKCTAEVLSEYQKELIEEVFDCPCISEYGSAETGVVSFECPARNNHIMAESVWVEFEPNDSMANDKYKKLIVTNLYNEAFPIIRYEVGDLASQVNGNCSCGRTLPLMSNVVGRVSDIVVGNENKYFNSSIFSYIIKNFIRSGNEFKQIRFIQKKIGEVEVDIVSPTPLNNDQISNMRKIMYDFFRDAMTFKIQSCFSLESDISGKFRYFISFLEQRSQKINNISKV